MFLFLLLTHAVYSAPDCPSSGACSITCDYDNTCSGVINGSDSDSFSIVCNGNRACRGLVVDGLKGAAGDVLSTCSGSYDCEGAQFNANTAVDAVFICNGVYACKGAAFTCGSGDCTLNCSNTTTACRGVSSVECEGGDSECNINCDGGCYGPMPWSCREYPCAVTIECDSSSFNCPAAPCASGERVCADHVTCVDNTTTCEEATSTTTTNGGGSNTTTAGGSTSADVTTTPADTMAPEELGTGLIIKTYSTEDCSGAPESEEVVDLGCTAPSPGSFVFSSCSNYGWCQTSPGSGTCGGITLDCARTQELNVCTELNGRNVKVTCAGIDDGAATSRTLAPLTLLAPALIAFFAGL